MTYRQPAFMVSNAFSAITDVANQMKYNGSQTVSNSERRNMIDGRSGSVSSWTATSTGSGPRFDLGSVPSKELNRLIIPSGHTGMEGKTLRVYQDTSFSYPSPTVVATSVISGSEVIDLSLSSGDEQYWIWQISDSVASDVYSVGGSWLGTYEQLSTASAVQPEFSNGWIDQVLETEFPSGIASIELASPRRTFSLQVRDVDPASTDYALLDQVMQARGRSFWYWPPDTTDAGPYLVRLSKRSERRQEFSAPSIGLRYRMSFEFVEDNL
jgi:hypothetical protein